LPSVIFFGLHSVSPAGPGNYMMFGTFPSPSLGPTPFVFSHGVEDLQNFSHAKLPDFDFIATMSSGLDSVSEGPPNWAVFPPTLMWTFMSEGNSPSPWFPTDVPLIAHGSPGRFPSPLPTESVPLLSALVLFSFP